MKEVRIYIETSLQGPAVKRGKYDAIVEFIKKDGEPETREVCGEEDETTFYRSTLLAIVKALKILTCPCRVQIYTYCTFIVTMAENGNLEAWKRAEWKKSSGEDVQHKELWREYAELAGRHRVTFVPGKHHEYRRYMQKRVQV